MPQVFLGIGSNIERERHVTIALDALRDLFGAPALSSVYETPALGFRGDPFLNLVARVHCELGVGALASRLRALEYAHGRPVDAAPNGPRQLDIDILTYGDHVGTIDGVTLPRPEILTSAFVLGPLAELAPEERHPRERAPYRELWQRFDRAAQPIAAVPFRWRGRNLSALAD